MLDTGPTPVETQSINTLLAPLRVLYSMETVEKIDIDYDPFMTNKPLLISLKISIKNDKNT